MPQIHIDDENFSYIELQIMIRALAEVADEHFECNDPKCNSVTLNRQMLITKLAGILNRIESQDGWLDRIAESWLRNEKI